jgi:hypothetical protein
MHTLSIYQYKVTQTCCNFFEEGGAWWLVGVGVAGEEHKNMAP